MSNTNTALILTGEIETLLKSIAPSAEGIEQKGKIIKLAETILQVTNESEAAQAKVVAENVKGYISSVESFGLASRRPFEAAKKVITGAEVKLTDDEKPAESPIKQLARINKLRSDYLQKLEAEAAAARKKLADEQARLAAEAKKIEDENKRLAAEAEKARIAAEQAKTKKQREAAAASLKEIEQKQLDASFAQADVAEKAQEIAQAAPIIDPLAGSGARKDFEIELTDALLFFTNFPEYCEITIKKNPFKELLKVHWTEKSVYPGVKITPKFSAPVRGVDPRLAIQ